MIEEDLYVKNVKVDRFVSIIDLDLIVKNVKVDPSVIIIE